MQHDEITEALFLVEENGRVGIGELVQISGLELAEMQELIEFGLFEPAGGEGETWFFPAHCITLAQTTRRLRRDFDLNVSGIALALTYLQRIQELEMQLREISCRLPE